MSTEPQKGKVLRQKDSAIQPKLYATDRPSEAHRDFLRIEKTLRIAVTGDVFLTRLEKEVIDTQDFQRLRGVRQLGSVNMVYPTALHTRFDHSLGTLSMASSMLRAIKDNTHSSEDERAIDPIQEALTRLYALLHDLPHVPFGHTIEDELRIFVRHDKNKARINRFFGRNSNVGKLIINHLGEDAYRRFMAIYQWDGESTLEDDDAFIYDLVSNTVCADLLDYLARDSYFCNLEIPLDYRFLNFLYLRRDEQNRRRVFVRLWKAGKPQPRRDTLTDLARLLEARYIVAERAYFHHAKIISGAMLGRAIQEANLAGELKEEDLYGHSDDTLIYVLRASKNPIAAKLSRMLAERKLHKELLKYSEEQFAGIQEHDHAHNVLNTAFSLVADPNNRKSIEDQLAAEVGAEPGDVIVYAPEKGMNLKAAEMKVLWKGEPKCLKDIDDRVIEPRLSVILEAHKKLWAIHVIVSPTLTEAQKEQLSAACEILFVCPPNQREAKQQHYYEGLIEQQLAKENIAFPKDIGEFRRLRAGAAQELITSANDNRSWAQRIKEVVGHFFGEQKG
ncbi:MAG: HD domain-containing protein [Acidobacteriota bacterium]|nr:HD domain-containing protein [Acidobacteriota bacterium]